MIEVPIYNQAGDKVETFQLDPAKLGGEVRTNLLKQALVMYHANQRLTFTSRHNWARDRT